MTIVFIINIAIMIVIMSLKQYFLTYLPVFVGFFWEFRKAIQCPLKRKKTIKTRETSREERFDKYLHSIRYSLLMYE